jgi:outer membrane receptor protein involved in Fe transport
MPTLRLSLLLAAGSPLPFVLPAAVQAQQAPPSVPTPAEDPRPGGDDFHGDIVVTAAAGLDTLDLLAGTSVLQGVELQRNLGGQIGEVLARLPGVSATSFSPGASRPVLRGFGGDRVRVLIDGIGSIDAAGTSDDHAVAVDPLIADRIEVLRGPQGTLFGKNTSAGALLLNSASPNMDEVSGFATASYGNYSAFDVSGAVNIPVSDTFALRVAASHSEQDGFLKSPEGNTEGDQNVDAFKVSALWEPTDTLSLKLIADYTKQDDEVGYATVNAVDGPLTPLINALTVANGLAVPSSNIDDYETSINTPTSNNVEDKGIALLVDWDVGPGTLKSVTALREYDTVQDADADFTGADILNINELFRSQFFSQEFTYGGELSGPVNANYLFGVFYSDEELDMGRNLSHGTQAQPFWNTLLGAQGVPSAVINAAPGEWAREVLIGKAESLALFTHWDFALTEKVNLIAGLR